MELLVRPLMKIGLSKLTKPKLSGSFPKKWQYQYAGCYPLLRNPVAMPLMVI
jgi:hypothetical protein